jgi:formylglycine-generating enzyme required for sulfatase activity
MLAILCTGLSSQGAPADAPVGSGGGPAITIEPTIGGGVAPGQTGTPGHGPTIEGRAVPPGQANAPFETYTETIAGTLVSFEMIPVSGAGIGSVWIGRSEVTWDEYDVWMLGLDHEPAERRGIDAESRPSRPYGAPDRGFGHAGFAAISVTYRAAQEYARWLADKTGRGYRLPLAEEWLAACRLGVAGVEAELGAAGIEGEAAGQTTGRAIAGQAAGEEPGSRQSAAQQATDDLDAAYVEARAWYAGNSGGTTHPAGSKQPDALGLFDMLGNAGEWVTRPGEAPALLGGSYRDPAHAAQCGAAALQEPSWNARDPQIPKSEWWLSDGPFAGFRVVRDPAGEGVSVYGDPAFGKNLDGSGPARSLGRVVGARQLVGRGPR